MQQHLVQVVEEVCNRLVLQLPSAVKLPISVTSPEVGQLQLILQELLEQFPCEQVPACFVGLVFSCLCDLSLEVGHHPHHPVLIALIGVQPHGEGVPALQQEVVKLALVLPFVWGWPGHVLLGFQSDEVGLVGVTVGSLLCRLHADNGVHPELASPDQDYSLHTIPSGGLCVSNISDGIHLHRTQQFQLPAQSLALSPHLLQVEQSLEACHLNLFG